MKREWNLTYFQRNSLVSLAKAGPREIKVSQTLNSNKKGIIIKSYKAKYPIKLLIACRLIISSPTPMTKFILHTVFHIHTAN